MKFFTEVIKCFIPKLLHLKKYKSNNCLLSRQISRTIFIFPSQKTATKKTSKNFIKIIHPRITPTKRYQNCLPRKTRSQEQLCGNSPTKRTREMPGNCAYSGCHFSAVIGNGFTGLTFTCRARGDL